MLRTRFLSLIRAANELGLEHEGSYLTMDGVNRLAELIDRPTTSNVQQADRSGHAPLGFTCELCGAQWPMDLGFVHCPECGAEVVSDE